MSGKNLLGVKVYVCSNLQPGPVDRNYLAMLPGLWSVCVSKIHNLPWCFLSNVTLGSSFFQTADLHMQKAHIGPMNPRLMGCTYATFLEPFLLCERAHTHILAPHSSLNMFHHRLETMRGSRWEDKREERIVENGTVGKREPRGRKLCWYLVKHFWVWVKREVRKLTAGQLWAGQGEGASESRLLT